MRLDIDQLLASFLNPEVTNKKRRAIIPVHRFHYCDLCPHSQDNDAEHQRQKGAVHANIYEIRSNIEWRKP